MLPIKKVKSHCCTKPNLVGIRLGHPVAVGPRERVCLGCLEEREKVERPSKPGLSVLSLSARQSMPSSPSPVALYIQGVPA